MGCAVSKAPPTLPAAAATTTTTASSVIPVANPGLSAVAAAPAGTRLSTLNRPRCSTNVAPGARLSTMNRPMAAGGGTAYVASVSGGAGAAVSSLAGAAALRPPTIVLDAVAAIGLGVPAQRRPLPARTVIFLFGGPRSHKGHVASAMCREYGFELLQLEEVLLHWTRAHGDPATTLRTLSAALDAHADLTWVRLSMRQCGERVAHFPSNAGPRV